ncbi:DUF2608 domain-containing protein [Paraglaciecola sp. L3A3]|uniref:DUF2608 domain-containing protein n=1 Tax=Paraglaciecola sp. L3A3 TaxID=2686358 RepID=UPI001E5E46F5|nr:DUF2608 domain-containing protein [Paraglaciecola sp. L3A3]
MLKHISFLSVKILPKVILYASLLGASSSLILTGCASDVSEVKPALSTNSAQAVSVIYQSWDLQDALDKAHSLDKESTLVVFDIDDTLLTATEFFGSDKWYDWQRGRALDQQGVLINTAATEKVNCLFDVLGMVFEIAVNKPTQANMADIVADVDNDLLILTARSGAYRAATMRELARNKLNFVDKSLLPADLGYHYDYTLGGRTAQVSYVNGVFMVQGMNKGVMLLDLLKRTGKNYQSVVFVDDKQHNIDNMADALKEANINYYGYHYRLISKAVTDSEVAEANSASAGLNRLLEGHFIDRAEHLSQGHCDY